MSLSIVVPHRPCGVALDLTSERNFQSRLVAASGSCPQLCSVSFLFLQHGRVPGGKAQ